MKAGQSVERTVHIQIFSLPPRMRICFLLLLILLSAKPIGVKCYDHKALYVALGGTVRKAKRTVTVHSLLNIVITIYGYTYGVRRKATISYFVAPETDSHMYIFSATLIQV